jgi:hypothetical protein
MGCRQMGISAVTALVTGTGWLFPGDGDVTDDRWTDDSPKQQPGDDPNCRTQTGSPWCHNGCTGPLALLVRAKFATTARVCP